MSLAYTMRHLTVIHVGSYKFHALMKPPYKNTTQTSLLFLSLS